MFSRWKKLVSVLLLDNVATWVIYSMIRANAGSNEGETGRTLARLDFEGYRRGDRVRVGGVESVP